jgi:hypothetical protein
MIVKRIGPMSLAKLSGTLYALIGLIIGAIVSAVSIIGGAMGGSDPGMVGLLFGAAAVVLVPLLYGCMGFVMSLIGASLFNLVAGWVGGIELATE